MARRLHFQRHMNFPEYEAAPAPHAPCALPAALELDLATLRPGAARLTGDVTVFRIPDLLQFLHATRKSGLLVVRSTGCVRALVFREGGIGWATSTRPAERTNELLCRVDLALRAAALLRHFGTDAATSLRRQIEAVLAGLVEQSAGTFALYELAPEALAGLSGFDTQELLLRTLVELAATG